MLGFPCNQFGNEEPGDDPEIRRFYTKTYGVTFDLFSKIKVKGPDAEPLYRWLTGPANPEGPLEIEWNFQKFLMDRKGRIVATFAPGVEPEDPEVIDHLEELLR